LAGSTKLFIHIINGSMFRLKYIYILQTVILKVILVEINQNKSEINGIAPCNRLK